MIDVIDNIKDIYVGTVGIKSAYLGNELIYQKSGGGTNYLQFADPLVEQICATNWGDGVGITAAQAAAVTGIGSLFKGKAITSFDEFSYFSGVTALAFDGGFMNCSYLVSISGLDRLVTLNRYAFYGCKNLESDLSFESVQTIASGVFQGCQKIKKITIGPNCTSIGQSCFQSTSLTTLIVKAVTPPTLGKNAFWAASVPSIYVPDESVDAYKAANNWSTNASKIKGMSELPT